MSVQIDLLGQDLPYPVRSTDPETSALASRLNGLHNGTDRMRILDFYCREWPQGFTDEEVAVAVGIPFKSCPWKRCSELRKWGAVEDTGLRRLTSTGAKAMVCVASSEALGWWRQHRGQEGIDEVRGYSGAHSGSAVPGGVRVPGDDPVSQPVVADSVDLVEIVEREANSVDEMGLISTDSLRALRIPLEVYVNDGGITTTRQRLELVVNFLRTLRTELTISSVSAATLDRRIADLLEKIRPAKRRSPGDVSVVDGVEATDDQFMAWILSQVGDLDNTNRLRFRKTLAGLLSYLQNLSRDHFRMPQRRCDHLEVRESEGRMICSTCGAVVWVAAQSESQQIGQFWRREEDDEQEVYWS